MADALDIKYINPFLQATISILEMLGMPGGKVGKPGIGDLTFDEDTFLIQVGVTGAMRGQVFFKMTDNSSKSIASTMMMGMPVNELDDMACSALGELGNARRIEFRKPFHGRNHIQGPKKIRLIVKGFRITDPLCFYLILFCTVFV